MNKTKLSYFDIRFKKLLKTKYIIVTSLILFIFIITYDLIFSIGLNKIVNNNNITYFYLLEVIIYSIINITLVIYFVWKLYYDDNNDGVNKLEMRIGLSKQFMYFYRLLLIFLYTIIFLLGEYILNSIFYAASFEKNKLFSFRLFISTFGWLAFISFFTIFISLLFTIIFKSRFVIIFSAIIAIVILFLSSISGNFISNKVAPMYDANPIISQQNPKSSWTKQYMLTDNEYVEIGLNFTNYSQFYQTIKKDKAYNFIAFIKEIYDPTLSKEENFTNILDQANEKYDSLNNFLIKIYQANFNDEWYKKISQELISTKNTVLIQYGEILSHSQLFSKNSKSSFEENEKLKNEFYEYIFNTFLYCEEGQDLDYILQYQVKLLNQFNEKMKKNAYFNPLYNLNLMFFGDSSDFFLDNLTNRTMPLFKQALNITFAINYQTINDGKTIIINYSIPKKTINTWYLVSVNTIIFIAISCLMYFGYKIKT